ncbi:MAG: hypothetical protein AAGH64_11580 [Planctomycetota bacterium]
MGTNETNTANRRSNTVLWASAFLLTGMILSQAGRVGLESEARADVSEVGDLTIASFRASDGSEPIAILSRRAERVFFYGISRGEIELLATEPLPETFVRARSRAGNPNR